MKATEILIKLESMIAHYGDLPVVYNVSDCGIDTWEDADGWEILINDDKKSCFSLW